MGITRGVADTCTLCPIQIERTANRAEAVINVSFNMSFAYSYIIVYLLAINKEIFPKKAQCSNSGKSSKGKGADKLVLKSSSKCSIVWIPAKETSKM